MRTFVSVLPATVSLQVAEENPSRVLLLLHSEKATVQDLLLYNHHLLDDELQVSFLVYQILRVSGRSGLLVRSHGRAT